ncbi:MAG: hypothetical protein V4478_03745 [Patescibacteria group bacterium]
MNTINTYEGNLAESKTLPEHPFGMLYVLLAVGDASYIYADTKEKDFGTVFDNAKKILGKEVRLLDGGELFYYGKEKGFLVSGKSRWFSTTSFENKKTKKKLEEIFSEQPITVEVENI